MATAPEYRAAAASLEQVRDELPVLVRAVATAADGVVAGPLATLLAAAVDALADDVRVAVHQLDAGAVEARRRADVCDAYARAVRVALRSDPPDRSWPRRPADWVELR